jgi:mono/diheme cytochrome c family protein
MRLFDRLQPYFSLIAGMTTIVLLVAYAFGRSDQPKVDPQTKSTFESTCATCHGADGSGTPLGKTLQAADLRSPEVQKKPDAELIQSVTNGKGNMPPFKGKITDQQISALIEYVRTLPKAKNAKTQ